jgi:hypothetical protein
MADDQEILVIGSQSILGSYSEDELPDEAQASVEVDVAAPPGTEEASQRAGAGEGPLPLE